jgi:hypothetical protein
MHLDQIVPAQGCYRVQFAVGLDCPQGDFKVWVDLVGVLVTAV